jgi:hypothetical protein
MFTRKKLLFTLTALVMLLSLAACANKGHASSAASSGVHAVATSSADRQAADDVIGKCLPVTSLGAIVNALDTKAKQTKVGECLNIPAKNRSAFKTAVTQSAITTYNQNDPMVKAKHTTWKAVFETWGKTQLPLIVKKYQA